MKRLIAGEDRQQITLLPDCLDDYITADNPVRLVEVFVDELDLDALGFAGAVPEATGRPAYHPATLLKIYLYGYLNRVPSSRRLERESQRDIELIPASAHADTFAHLRAAMAVMASGAAINQFQAAQHATTMSVQVW